MHHRNGKLLARYKDKMTVIIDAIKKINSMVKTDIADGFNLSSMVITRGSGTELLPEDVPGRLKTIAYKFVKDILCSYGNNKPLKLEEKCHNDYK